MNVHSMGGCGVRFYGHEMGWLWAPSNWSCLDHERLWFSRSVKTNCFFKFFWSQLHLVCFFVFCIKIQQLWVQKQRENRCFANSCALQNFTKFVWVVFGFWQCCSETLHHRENKTTFAQNCWILIQKTKKPKIWSCDQKFLKKQLVLTLGENHKRSWSKQDQFDGA